MYARIALEKFYSRLRTLGEKLKDLDKKSYQFQCLKSPVTLWCGLILLSSLFYFNTFVLFQFAFALCRLTFVSTTQFIKSVHQHTLYEMFSVEITIKGHLNCIRIYFRMYWKIRKSTLLGLNLAKSANFHEIKSHEKSLPQKSAKLSPWSAKFLSLS